MSKEKILIVDFADPTAMVLAKYIRGYHVYSEVVHFTKCMESIAEEKPIGIVLANYEGSVNDCDAPMIPIELLQLGIPVLGVGYGMHVIVKLLGGEVSYYESEYDPDVTIVKMCENTKLFKSVRLRRASYHYDDDNGRNYKDKLVFGLPHDDIVVKLPPCFEVTMPAWSDHIDNFVIEDQKNDIYGVEAIPVYSSVDIRVSHYLNGFLFDICNAKDTWKMDIILSNAIEDVKKQVGNKNVLLALSGGVDSTVLAHLLNKAIGKQLTCVFVDTGLMRKHESKEIRTRFENQGFNFHLINAKAKFIQALKGITDPEEKRRVIGETFIRVFEESAKEIGDVDFLAQGTIYADVLESGATKDGRLVKSHHNVGGLPSVMDFKGIIEPFRELLKEEVREIGKLLELPDSIINRQPFPGPGLAVRVIGEVTKKKLDVLREADYIWRRAIESNKRLLENASQYFAVLTDMRSVGVIDGERTYGYVLALRCINTDDFMSAEAVLPSVRTFDFAIDNILERVPLITRIVFDVTSKPPATIEWE